MWLDRFSGQSNPTGATSPNRPYSPSPRKPSQLSLATRSGLGVNPNRSTTSLDLSTNTSTVSLASPTKLTNGSSLRYEQKPPPDVSDPLDVLRSILGSLQDDRQPGFRSDKHDEVDDVDIDFGDLSLEEFANQVDVPIPKQSPVQTVSIAVGDNRQKFEDFHRSITESDQVLKSVELYLTNFKAELGQVSAEIENLQTRSIQLTTRLDNRRKVEKLLGPAVEDASISPVTVRAIADGPIDDAFIKALHEIEARSVNIDAKEKSSDLVKALDDVKPLLEDLRTKAIERARDYIVSQIKALRSPNINAQILQQQNFLRYKDLYAFLSRHHQVLAEEIGQAYINTMKWYYNSHFTRYLSALQKLQLHVLDQHDLMGAESAPSRRNMLSTSKAPLPQHDAFSLGKRSDVIRSKNESALPAHLAEENKTPHYLETVFRNFNKALIDNVCAEYSMVTEFFAANSYHQVARKVVEIFEPVFATGHTLTKQLVDNTTDCLGVLICVRLNQNFAFELQKRKVPVADNYINYTNILLWPRFQMIMDQHRESLKKVSTSSNRGTAAAFTLVGGNDPSKASLAPHAVTQRFGQFLQGILTLSTEGGDDEPIANSLLRLRGEFEALLMKLSKSVGDATKRGRFLFNNYSLVLTIISDSQGKLAQDQKEHFETLLKDTKVK